VARALLTRAGETSVIDFVEGYLNRRINITMLYGRRTAGGR
jgi:hypothetical protein